VAIRREGSIRVPRTARDVLALTRTWAVEGYLGAILVGTVFLAARSNGLSAYYALIPLWAGLALVMAVLVRWRALPVAGLLVYAFLVAYAGLLKSPAVAPSILEASRRLSDAGATATALLGDRQVRSVTWRAEDSGFGSWYLLRDQRQPPPGVASGPDLWPWLTRTTEPIPLQDLRSGTLPEILDDLPAHAGPGEVVMVVDDQYRLALLTFEGTVLYLDRDDDGTSD
jgi:hypothetical protein